MPDERMEYIVPHLSALKGMIQQLGFEPESLESSHLLKALFSISWDDVRRLQGRLCVVKPLLTEMVKCLAVNRVISMHSSRYAVSFVRDTIRVSNHFSYLWGQVGSMEVVVGPNARVREEAGDIILAFWQ